jgi:hypothetical protein
MRSRHPPTSRHVRERCLAHYDGETCGRREIVECEGVRGSRLVVDQVAGRRRDRRLVAHIAADEPAGNAELVCRRYLESEPATGPRCRRLTDDDLRAMPFVASSPPGEAPPFSLDAQPVLEVSGTGRAYRIAPVRGRLRIPELRWTRVGAQPAAVSLRDIVADLEDYEPACTTTARAVRAQVLEAVSTSALAVELSRVQSSAIVLNRRLRQAVLEEVARGQVSMSEIAMRCGRVKHDARGNASGETSWLARRLGLLAEGGQQAPTPWIHSDVLGLIARRGLGISPREVEL